MKYFFIFLVCLIPFEASASIYLSNCDDIPHDVFIRNGGQERNVTLTKFGGGIEEFGPMVSFQITDKISGNNKPQPITTPISPDEEFCIWNGKIKIQRLKTHGFNGGGNSLR